MPLEDFLDKLATITAEASAGQLPPQTATGGADRMDRLVVVAGVACMVRPQSSTLSAFGSSRDDKRANVVNARIYFDADPVPEGLSTRHWIEVDGKTYKVTGVIDPNSMGRIFQVDCEMTTP